MHSDPYSVPGKTYPSSSDENWQVFRPKRRTNHTLWGGTNVTYKTNVREHYPPPPTPRGKRSFDSNKLNCNGSWADCVQLMTHLSTSATYTVNIY